MTVDTFRALNLTPTNTDVNPLGTAPLALNTANTYKKHVTGMIHFFSLIGDYQSMLILLKRPPVAHCCSIDVESITLYIDYKREKWKGKSLLKSDGTVQLDVFGDSVLCFGGWKTPHNAAQLITAVNALHKAKDLNGPYSDICDRCVLAVSNGEPGCQYHLYSPKTFRTGDPSKSRLVTDAVKKNIKSIFFLILFN